MRDDQILKRNSTSLSKILLKLDVVFVLVQPTVKRTNI